MKPRRILQGPTDNIGIQTSSPSRHSLWNQSSEMTVFAWPHCRTDDCCNSSLFPMRRFSIWKQPNRARTAAVNCFDDMWEANKSYAHVKGHSGWHHTQLSLSIILTIVGRWLRCSYAHARMDSCLAGLYKHNIERNELDVWDTNARTMNEADSYLETLAVLWRQPNTTVKNIKFSGYIYNQSRK